MLIVFVLVLTRVLGMFAGAPVFSRRSLPGRFRTLLAVGIAGSLLPVADPSTAPTEGPAVFVAMVSEFMIGMAIGLLARFMLSAFQLAGAIVSFQMGFAVANAFDPDTGTSSPILSTLHLQLVTMLFLALDGHHLLIRSLATSYASFPLGGGVDTALLSHSLVGATTSLYDLGARVAGPVSALMLLINATIGFLNRVVPQLSIFSIGFPMTVCSGLIAVMISIPEVAAFFLRAFVVLENQLAALILA